MKSRSAAYVRKTLPPEVTRLIAVIPNDEVKRLDAWGVAAAMPSRTATVRHLIKKGLEAVASETAAAGDTSTG